MATVEAAEWQRVGPASIHKVSTTQQRMFYIFINIFKILWQSSKYVQIKGIIFHLYVLIEDPER